MKYRIETLMARIDERLTKLRISERAASISATGKPDAIRYIRKRNAWPSAMRLAQLAVALKATPNYLIGRADENDWEGLDTSDRFDEAIDQLYNVDPRQGDDFSMADLSSYEEEEGDIAVYKTSWKGIEEFDGLGEGSKALVETATLDTSKLIKSIISPRGLVGQPYALFSTSSSMTPAINAGDLVFCDIRRPPSPGDAVIVLLRRTEENDADHLSTVFFARFLRRDREVVVVQQHAHPADIRIPPDRLGTMHRIMSTRELFGL